MRAVSISSSLSYAYAKPILFSRNFAHPVNSRSTYHLYYQFFDKLRQKILAELVDGLIRGLGYATLELGSTKVGI